MVNIDLQIERGEFVVLTGPSGCGKTTLCRCINGLIPSFYNGTLTGQVTICGLEVRDHPTSQLAKHAGMVFQNPDNQLFSLSVERDVAFGPENLGLPRGETRKRVEWAMAATGISDLRDRAPYELSGGQQQRAAIASVLAMQPEIMVLDEPTSFLDPMSAEGIISVIANLNRTLRITTILVEHRLDLVSQYADRVIVMDDGKIELNGAPSDVYGERAHLIGIGLPRVTLLFHQLRRAGFRLTSNPTTVDEAVKELRVLLK